MPDRSRRRPRVPDEYRSFAAMAATQKEGHDFTVRYEVRNPEAAIIAIHGGAIERHTDTLAVEIAGADLSYYTLVGQRRNENRRYLHVASELFDEPRLSNVLQAAKRVVSIHGVEDHHRSFVMLGGLDLELKRALESRLREIGITVLPPRDDVRGVDTRNVCNKGVARAGAQIEISTRLRAVVGSDEKARSAFCNAVRSVCIPQQATRVVLGMAQSSLDLRGAKAQKLELDLLRLAYAVDRIRHRGAEAQGYLLVMTASQATRLQTWLAKYEAGDLVRTLIANPQPEVLAILKSEKSDNAFGMMAGMNSGAAGLSSAAMGQEYGERRLHEMINELEPSLRPTSDPAPLGVQWDFYAAREVSGAEPGGG